MALPKIPPDTTLARCGYVESSRSRHPSPARVGTPPSRHPSDTSSEYANSPPTPPSRGYVEISRSGHPSPARVGAPPSRHPSNTGSEYARPHTSPVQQPGYYNPTPSPHYRAPDGSTRSRTMSHTTVPRHGGFYDTSPVSPPAHGHGDPYLPRGRPGFVSSPSQLSYSHVDAAYTPQPDENLPPSKAPALSPQHTGPVPPDDEFSKILLVPGT
ncbi:hypothetical protein K438DRAFT_140548 [Mycena galopus ATCC 62051]|nr:hypothetical protein K438DRAFT_140548 [Mycena galopus ATCC 62051]